MHLRMALESDDLSRLFGHGVRDLPDAVADVHDEGPAHRVQVRPAVGVVDVDALRPRGVWVVAPPCPMVDGIGRHQMTPSWRSASISSSLSPRASW